MPKTTLRILEQLPSATIQLILRRHLFEPPQLAAIILTATLKWNVESEITWQRYTPS